MRVVVEKVGSGPDHALSSTEVRTLIRAAEAELGTFPGLKVHLKATLPANTLFDRPVIYSRSGNRLNVICRGLAREVAVREVLRELVRMAADPVVRQGHRLSAAQLRAIDVRVDQILPKVMESLGVRGT